MGATITWNTDSDTSLGWKNIKINFLVTSRADLEMGDIYGAFQAISSNSVLPLSYIPKNQNFSTDYLRVNTFLQALTASTTSNQIGFILEGFSFTNVGLNQTAISFRIKVDPTVNITKLVFSVVLFELNNPAFRYEDGAITQTFLDSTASATLPPVLDGESRSFIFGVNAFLIQTNSQISLASGVSSNSTAFAFSVGPGADNCLFNYLSLSYLVLSINKCGFCKGQYYIYNNSCFSSCPFGTVSSKGSICIPLVCPSSQYIAPNNTCTVCPKHSNIAICNNSCGID